MVGLQHPLHYKWVQWSTTCIEYGGSSIIMGDIPAEASIQERGKRWKEGKEKREKKRGRIRRG